LPHGVLVAASTQFLAAPFEVKQVAKTGEKYGKIWKTGYFIEF
jgi:hypothetical protein